MKLQSLIAFSLVLLAQPVLAAPPKARPSTVCTFLSEVALDAARERDAGWTVDKSLADMKPSIARAPVSLQERRAAVVRLAYASVESPEAFKTSIAIACMTPETSTPPSAPPAVQQAQAPRSTHATQLEMCASLGGIAESFVQFRDAGIPLTTILQGLLPKGAVGILDELMQPLVLDIYRHSYWDAVYARRQAETRCVATITH